MLAWTTSARLFWPARQMPSSVGAAILNRSEETGAVHRPQVNSCAFLASGRTKAGRPVRALTFPTTSIAGMTPQPVDTQGQILWNESRVLTSRECL